MNEINHIVGDLKNNLKRKMGAIKAAMMSSGKVRLLAGDLFNRQEQAFREASPKLAKASQQNFPSAVYLWNNEQECLIGGNAVIDQGDSNICVAISVCTIAEWQIHQQSTETVAHLEPLAIYNLRENYPEEGMTGDDAFEIGIRYGFLDEKDFPRLATLEERLAQLQRQHKQSTSEYRNLVNQYRRQAFVLSKYNNNGNETSNQVSVNESNHVYALVDTVYDMRRALAYGNGPMSLFVPVHNEQDPDGRIYRKISEVTTNNATSSPELGHCMTIVGYDDSKKAFLVRNSWGKTWGPLGNGHFWMPYRDVDDKLYWDCYVMFIDGKLHLKYIHDQQQQQAGTGPGKENANHIWSPSFYFC